MTAADPHRRGSASMLPLVAAGLVAVHTLDDAFVQPEPGTAAGDHLISGLVPLCALALVTILAVRGRPGVRAVATVVVGLSAVVAGLEGAHGVRLGGPVRDDYTGLAALVAGVGLLVVTAVRLWRDRQRTGSRLRRYLRRGLVTVAGLLLALQVGYPMVNAYAGTHLPSPEPTWVEIGPGQEPVEIVSGDAVIRGWYVPSRNRAAVITYPDRGQAEAHARFLVRHGYGVLLLDRRGHGGSTGDPNPYGWGEHRDIAAAIAFLRGRTDVDPGLIGGIGFSVGGEVLLEAAARTSGLRAVVAEGAGFRSVREFRHLGPSRWFTYPLVSVATASTAVFAGQPPPPDLLDLMGRIGPRPVLLIQAETGLGGEELNPVYAAAAGPTAEAWRVPGSTHVGGLHARPQEYERRVVGFFDRALLGAPS